MTKIEWADKTWNPVTGCTKISEGCKHCYAERMSHRLKGRFGYPEDDPFAVTLHPDKLNAPLKWKKPRKVFVCSMGDLFHKNVPSGYVQQVFDLIAQTPQHTYLILTKRPHRMKMFFVNNTDVNGYLHTWNGRKVKRPLPNVWGLVTAENQEQADLRIPLLLQSPFAVRGVSIEPMLSPIILQGGNVPASPDGPWPPKPWHSRSYLRGICGDQRLDWVICGGETGPGARPMAPNWARSLRDQCKDASIPFFFKKMGQGQPTPADLMIREWPTQK